MIIKPANRLQTISEYYFSKKLEEVRRMNEAGLDVINLGIGSPDMPPSPEVITAATEALQSKKNHGYPSYRSTPALRAAIASWYQQTYQVELNSEGEVLPLLGSKEGLFYIAMAFLNPGDQALVPNPGYPAYASVTTLTGATPLTYDLSEEGNWWPDFDKLEKTDLSKVKLMYVNYPHMPTGAVGSPELFQKLIDFGKRHRILICHDNPYGLVLNVDPPMSILKFDPQMEVSLELNSFSKAFNMAGWRAGMLLANSEVIETVLKVKSNVDSGMFLPLQSGAIEALKTGEAWHAERNEVYRERRNYAEKVFAKLGCTVRPNQVGLFLWAKAPDHILNVEAHVDEILQKARVLLTPGFIFGTQGSRYLRCSLCAPVERLKEALERMEKSI